MYSRAIFWKRYLTVPDEFVFPVGDVRSIWDLWWHGNYEQRIGPYKFLQGTDFRDNVSKVNLSKARGVMKALITKAGEMSASPTPSISMTYVESDAYFASAFLGLMQEVMHSDGENIMSPLDRRINHMCYLTLYDLIRIRS